MASSDRVVNKLSKSSAFIWLTRSALLVWLGVVLLCGVSDSPLNNLWARVLLPVGYLLVGLRYMGMPSLKRYGFTHWLAIITNYLYFYTVKNADFLTYVIAAVYDLLSAAVVLFVLYRYYKIVDTQLRSPVGEVEPDNDEG
jgi:hypothetical protein